MQLYILAGISIVIMSIFAGYNYMSSKIAQLEKELVTSKSEKIMCHHSLENQTALVESQREDYEIKLKKFKEIKPEVRYKVVYRDIIRDINTSKESSCEDTKQVISNIRNIDFNAL